MNSSSHKNCEGCRYRWLATRHPHWCIMHIDEPKELPCSSFESPKNPKNQTATTTTTRKKQSLVAEVANGVDKQEETGGASNDGLRGFSVACAAISGAQAAFEEFVGKAYPETITAAERKDLAIPFYCGMRATFEIALPTIKTDHGEIDEIDILLTRLKNLNRELGAQFEQFGE